MKNIFPFLFLILMFSCTEKKVSYVEFIGEAQGTTFYISYYDSLETDYSADIQKILENFDQELSTYKPGSVINQFNNNEIDSFPLNTEYFEKCCFLSSHMKEYTQGYFDFGLQNLILASKKYEKLGKVIPKNLRDSILQIPTTFFGSNWLMKLDKRIKFNFNAIAQGYSVDVLSDFLESNGVMNYMVEIGGEIRVKGINDKGELWTVSLEAPNSTRDDRKVQKMIAVDNKAVVTSGSYRKFKEIDGIKYSHAINPKTGLGVTHNLLSVSIICEKAAVADALATAFLVMGKEKTIQFLDANNKYKVSLLFIEVDSNNEYESSTFGDFEQYEF